MLTFGLMFVLLAHCVQQGSAVPSGIRGVDRTSVVEADNEPIRVRRNMLTASNTTTSSVGHLMKFRLINADTNLPVPEYDPLESGAVIDVAMIGTRNLNIEAVASSGPSSIGSVQFDWDARPRIRVENSAPWAFCGNSGRDFFACDSILGSPIFEVGTFHRITATSYAGIGANKSASAGNTISVWFRIEDSATRPPEYVPPEQYNTKLVLVDTDTDKDITVLYQRFLLETAIFPRISIRAEPDPSFPTQSVMFRVDGKFIRIDNTAPYALNGNIAGDYFSWSPNFTGSTAIEATLFSGWNGTGTEGERALISILIRIS